MQTENKAAASASLTLNIGGKLMDLGKPVVMGILNVTPDSFYEASRAFDEKLIAQRAEQIVAEGGGIIDVGAYSTRPGSAEVDEKEEMSRLRRALSVIRKTVPDAVISVDTFRASCSRMCVEEYGANIINDVSGGDGDPEMFAAVAKLGVPYVLSHIGGTVDDMHSASPLTSRLSSDVPYMQGVMAFLTKRIDSLRSLGAKDIIIDPGFGFGKSLEQNYELLLHLDFLKIWNLPILVGFSRKSMIYKLLGTDPSGALGGTIACNTIALMKGADIVRVHDVKAAAETVKIVSETLAQQTDE